mmetsp:Transcript_17662/g.32916  ORF Transcript_17662/g.32916 Transcript_17662/m.32916 type:complete len:187 (+) Transcript_17662:216-776(+)
MGRYTSVQAFSDANPNMRKIPLPEPPKPTSNKAAASDKEIDLSKQQSKSVKVEKVNNLYGSVSGSCSGDFHVYRHSRRRETERLRALEDQETSKNKLDDFLTRKAKEEQESERITEKNRKKRRAQKASKSKKRKGGWAKEVEEKVWDFEGEEGDEEGDEAEGEEEEVKEVKNDGSFLEMMLKAKKV